MPIAVMLAMEERTAISTEPGGPAPERQETIVTMLAGELLDAVESGSSTQLLEALSRIAVIDPGAAGWQEPGTAAMAPEDSERLELLRALAVQLRLDLHAMLMHIYQRIEASRGYLEVVRHLAGREERCECGLWSALPGMHSRRTKDGLQTGGGAGQDLGAEGQSGEN